LGGSAGCFGRAVAPDGSIIAVGFVAKSKTKSSVAVLTKS
jgi:hypothetical protein